MFKDSFITPALRELLDYLSPLALEVVPWLTLVQTGPTLLRRLVTKDGVPELVSALQSHTPDGILFAEDDDELSEPQKNLAESDRHFLGDQVLRLYFSQLKCVDGLFIDLRSSRFTLQDDRQVTFKPNGMWTTLKESSREGLIDLYKGFYQDDDATYERGLSSLGMLKPEMSAEARFQLKALLSQHFGNDGQSQVRFSVERFRESFHSLFKFFVDQRIKLDGDFLFIGLYLVTLYLNLDTLGQKHDVRDIFQECFPA